MLIYWNKKKKKIKQTNKNKKWIYCQIIFIILGHAEHIPFAPRKSSSSQHLNINYLVKFMIIYNYKKVAQNNIPAVFLDFPLSEVNGNEKITGPGTDFVSWPDN